AGVVAGSAGATSDAGATSGARADAATEAPSDARANSSDAPPDVSSPAFDGGGVAGAPLPRVVAYVNCTCGFGAGAQGETCLATPDPTVNHVKAWEDAATSPITHYVISFLSFKGGDVQTDPGNIWKNGGGSTTDFALDTGLREAMLAAHAHGKKVLLSLGGEVGSNGFLAWWNGQGATTPARVAGMRAKLAAAVAAFTTQNGFAPDGVDVDIELGGAYAYGSDKYDSTRDLINAVPDNLTVAFVPQVGNGLCAAPSVGDPLPPTTVLGGQCMNPVMGDDTPWVLARLDKDCVRAGCGPRLEYFGIQYYNAGQAECCGGGADAIAMARSTAQSYVNLANGWPAPGDLSSPTNPWHAYQYFPGPWAAFGGIGADRLVLGKPGCQGCAGSNYLDPAAMKDVLSRLDHKLAKPMGGVLFWDLCRLFGNKGPQCVSGACQPSWGGADPRAGLAELRAQMTAIRAKP
ncbi:MAG: hypothetical protein JWM82_2227, partial [Myxococcales bacterium]|nr:hypothetical protein [Myxococcales bacterium]